VDDIFDFLRFNEIPLTDTFFDSLKQDYKEFHGWYSRKAHESESAYVQYTNGKLTGFMYLKIEEGEISDISPPLPDAKRLKIGTLKVDAHGTKLGERFIKKAFDSAIVNKVDEIYVTVFARHKLLIELLEEYGFVLAENTKTTINGIEKIYIKDLKHRNLTGNLRKGYPFTDTRKSNCFLLGIRSQWHSKLFPDSILNTESYDLLSDISFTNSISKIYICSMEGVDQIKPGDLIVIYRMKAEDDPGFAEYRSVATSICVVEEFKDKHSFNNVGEYLTYTKKYSVFDELELKNWWKLNKLYIIKLLYNAALTKRVIRKTLAEDVGIDRDIRWGFVKLTKNQFLKIASLGGVDERLIIH
jgi:hypothetical protein